MFRDGVLDNQVALVTGGARGIGRAICLQLAQLGAQVYFTYYQSQQQALEFQDKLAGIGNQGVALEVDVCSSSSCVQAMDKIMEKTNQIDLLVNNSGITRDNLLVGLSDEDISAVLNTNVVGVFNACRAVVPYMCVQRKGLIINISSVASVRGNRGQSNYVASKGAVNAMTQALAVELAPRNIRVNAIAPGVIETKMGEDLRKNSEKEILQGILCKRFGKPEEIAYAVAFLASPYAQYINGEVLFVDGGRKAA